MQNSLSVNEEMTGVIDLIPVECVSSMSFVQATMFHGNCADDNNNDDDVDDGKHCLN